VGKTTRPLVEVGLREGNQERGRLQVLEGERGGVVGCKF
jgi:hypothetical protein